MKESISNELKETFKNPDSFEFVSMKIDSELNLKKINETEFLQLIKDLQQLIIDKKKINQETDKDEKTLAELQKEYKFIKEFKGDKKDAVEYYVHFVAKGTNSFNAVIQTKYGVKVLNDENKTVVSISEIE